MSNSLVHCLFLVLSFYFLLTTAMVKTVERIEIPNSSIGTKHVLYIHEYKPVTATSKAAYIQGSLHADELPGIMVNHHLLRMLDEAEKNGDILEKITVVPYANPMGLSQWLLGSHIGRFNFDTAVNFNRDWPEYTKSVISSVEGKLSTTDANVNVQMIRNAILDALEKDTKSIKEEQILKKILFKRASVADVVLDLHCDTWAVMHMYTHDKLWPEMSDLACELRSECQLTAPLSGGSPFDEACSCLWASVQEKFPEYPIPMACQSVTIELRGEHDVSDDFAHRDAEAIFRFLQRRGYVKSNTELGPLPSLIRDATPLTGVDMIEGPVVGVVNWLVQPGDFVTAGQLLGEIINVEDHNAPRTPVTSTTDGLVFGMRPNRLVRAGQIIIKVSGEHPLGYRTGNLLTSK